MPHASEETDAANDEARAARADDLEVELLSAANPSFDAPTGEMTIPSFLAPEDTLESEVPRVVAGRSANGFVSDSQEASVWARGPMRAKPLGAAPRIELRRRSRRPLARIDDGSAAETTEWMAQALGQPTADAEGVPFGPRVVEGTDGAMRAEADRSVDARGDADPIDFDDVEALADDAIAEPDPVPARMNPADVVYVRRSAHAAVEADPFRTYVLKRRGPEDELTAPPAPWLPMIGQVGDLGGRGRRRDCGGLSGRDGDHRPLPLLKRRLFRHLHAEPPLEAGAPQHAIAG